MVSYNNEILVSDIITELPLHQPILTDKVVTYLILRGAVRITVDGAEFQAEEGGYVVQLPEQNFEVTEITPDFQAQYIQLSVGFLQRLQIEDGFDIHQQVARSPYMALQKEAFDATKGCIDIIHSILEQTYNPHRDKMVYHLMMAYYYGLGALIYPRSTDAQYSGRDEEITHQFYEQVRFRCREHHDVAYYADLLHVSPKYLSACVKLVTNKSAKQHIDDQIMNYAMTMLRDKKRSVSEIAYELHFPDQSAFGKFFRTRTNLGPKEWRLKYVND